MTQWSRRAASVLAPALLMACTTACTRKREELKSEPVDAASPYPCQAVNNEATALMLHTVPGDGGFGLEVPDAPRAARLYEEACPRCAVSCANLAMALLRGQGVAKNVERALGLYQANCDAGDLVACVSLGQAYDTGFDVKADPARAEQLYRKACDGGSGLGCSNLAGLFNRADGGAEDPRVKALYEKSCDAGVYAGCVNIQHKNEGLSSRIRLSADGVGWRRMN